jgi:hypothetical protein
MSTNKKDPFAGYVPHGPEWKAYLMKQPKALIVEVATGIADERDRLKAEKKELMEALRALLDCADAIGAMQGEPSPEEEQLLDSRTAARAFLTRTKQPEE